jgi:hypothetical protein
VRRVTPATMLPTLVAFVLAGVLGVPGGAPTVAPQTGPSVPTNAASIHAAAPRLGSQAWTQAPAAGRASMATDALHPGRLAQTGSATAGHAGPGAALATLSYRLSLDRLRQLLAIPTGGHPAGIDFSSFRSRAPPRISW